MSVSIASCLSTLPYTQRQQQRITEHTNTTTPYTMLRFKQTNSPTTCRGRFGLVVTTSTRKVENVGSIPTIADSFLFHIIVLFSTIMGKRIEL